MEDITELNQTLLSVKYAIGLGIILSNSYCFNVAKQECSDRDKSVSLESVFVVSIIESNFE